MLLQEFFNCPFVPEMCCQTGLSIVVGEICPLGELTEQPSKYAGHGPTGVNLAVVMDIVQL